MTDCGISNVDGQQSKTRQTLQLESPDDAGQAEHNSDIHRISLSGGRHKQLGFVGLVCLVFFEVSGGMQVACILACTGSLLISYEACTDCCTTCNNLHATCIPLWQLKVTELHCCTAAVELSALQT